LSRAASAATKSTRSRARRHLVQPGRGSGIGLYGVVVTNTLRDSLILLSLLLGQQTPLQPTEIMTDTGAYADSMFGLLWLLGFQFSPRLSDVGATRLWRIDRTADYGVLNDLSRHPLRTQLIVDHWDDLLRLAGSLSTGTVQAESLVRTLQRGDRPTKLGRALQELGRVIKTLFVLNYIDDEAYRQRLLTQLNRGEGRHKLARVVFYGQRGELRQRYREGQENQLTTLSLAINAIIVWNTLYLERALDALRAAGHAVRDEDVARLSPLVHERVNVSGRYSFSLPEDLQRGESRPLRVPMTRQEHRTRQRLLRFLFRCCTEPGYASPSAGAGAAGSGASATARRASKSSTLTSTPVGYPFWVITIGRASERARLMRAARAEAALETGTTPVWRSGSKQKALSSIGHSCSVGRDAQW
jgi:TnpA family transposase